MNKYLVQDIIRFSILTAILSAVLIGAYFYDRSTQVVETTAAAVYNVLID